MVGKRVSRKVGRQAWWVEGYGSATVSQQIVGMGTTGNTRRTWEQQGGGESLSVWNMAGRNVVWVIKQSRLGR